MSRRAAAALLDATDLELGARGAFEGEAFELVGRVVVESDGGGVWSEWRLAFGKKRAARTRWLAETPSGLILFDEAASLLPPASAVRVGEPALPRWVVQERGSAKVVATEGAEPSAARRYRYVDATAQGGAFATFDYGTTPPGLYLGRRVTRDALGLPLRRAPRRHLPIGGAVDEPPRGHALLLEVGAEGELAGERVRVVAVLGRSVRASGWRYAWKEYVLHAPGAGVRFLAEGADGLSLVRLLDAAEVALGPEGATHEGTAFVDAGEARATLDWAIGALPWRANVGDAVRVRELDAVGGARATLSCEASEDEVVWARGASISAPAVKRAFRGLREIRVTQRRRGR